MRGGDELRSLLDDARHDHAVDQRRRRRELHDREGALATWEGALLDLAEVRATVHLELEGGQRQRGALLATGHDHLLLAPRGPRSVDDARVAVALSAVLGLHHVAGPGGAPPVHSDRRPARRRYLVDVVEELVAGAVDVAFALRGTSTVLRGSPARVGSDVIVLIDPEARVTVVPVRSIARVSWGDR